MRAAYAVLPLLVVAVHHATRSPRRRSTSAWCCSCYRSSGLVWGIDQLFFRKPREAAAQRRAGAIAVPEPGTVDYARSFFPVAFIVLIVRAFIFEPFRIPSDSMMPTLLDGDFIVVNKFAYGLRWPVVNHKFVDIGRAAARRRGGVPLSAGSQRRTTSSGWSGCPAIASKCTTTIS